MNSKPKTRQRKRVVTVTAIAPKAKTNRLWVVLAALVLWIGGIGLRLVHLQTAQHAELSARAEAQRRRERKTRPLRGSILDRHGRELAITLEVESLAVDPTGMTNFETSAFQLAKTLGKNPKELILALNEARAANRRYFPLERELAPEIIEKIKNLNLSGLIWTKEQKRSYPNQSLAAHVIGFTNRDDAGQAGIEVVQEKNLRGDFTVVTEEKDGSGRTFEITENAAQPPRDVILTIDSSIQFRVEQALQSGISATRAKAGAAVVLNPKNGEILAMANAPAFDLNDLSKIKQESWANRAVQNVYEPGSTFKLVTYSAALEEGEARLEDSIDCSAGFIKIGSRQIKDTGRAGVLDLTAALAKSSNVAAITLGQRVGKDRLHEYIRRFGYGSTTGVELPTESRGTIFAPEKWSADSIGSVPIGYEVGVTTLQSAAAFAAIANDGVRVAPHIIKEIRHDDGRIHQQTQPEQRRVVSQATARQMRQMLRAVTEEGTAKRARLDGYTSAGKTGTAHKFDTEKNRYSSSKFVASFVGFAPAENPEIVVAVMIDEPQGGMHHGGDAAAPVFRDIAEGVLSELRIAPDALENQIILGEQTTAEPTGTVIQTAPEKTTNEKAITAKVVDNRVEKQNSIPKPSSNLPQPKTVQGLKNGEPGEQIVNVKKVAVKAEASKSKLGLSDKDKPKPALLNAATKTKAESPPKNSGKTKGKT